MPQMLLCLRQRGCARVASVTEEDCFVAAAAGVRTLEAGTAGGQAVPLLASALLLCQHTCQPLELLTRDISGKLACCLQLLPLLHSALLHPTPAKPSLLL